MDRLRSKGVYIFSAIVIIYFFVWTSSGAQNKDPLLFPRDAYSVEIKTVKTSDGEKKVTYHSYMHILYVSNPVDRDYQSMNVSVPVKVEDKTIDAANAPILFYIGAGGWMSVNNTSPGFMGGFPGMDRKISVNTDLALAAGYVVVSPGCRGRENRAPDGTYYGKAPAAVVDLKAAIRYIRHNKGTIPGNANRIVSTGVSSGGALSAIIGVSGNSKLFEPYLKEIGSANERDDIYASACFCPITDYDHADEAFEWMYGTTPTASGVVDQELSNELRQAFIEYQASLRLKGKKSFGIITAANYSKYLLNTYLIPSANKYLNRLSNDKRKEYLEKNKWIVKTDNGVTFSFSDFVKYVGRYRGVPAFDDFDMKNPAPILFGTRTTNARHYTNFTLRHSSSNKNTRIDGDLQNILNMMNPMYFIIRNKDDCADYWWIRHGTRDNVTSLPVITNLAISLENRNKKVNTWLYWDGMHGADEDTEDFITWIGNITGFSKKTK